jgi:hypothetical protein
MLNEESTEAQSLESLASQIHLCFSKQDHYKGEISELCYIAYTTFVSKIKSYK